MAEDTDGKALTKSVTFWGAVAVIAQAVEHMTNSGIAPNDIMAIAGAVGVIYGRLRATHLITKFL